MVELELFLVVDGSAKWCSYSEKECGLLERLTLLTLPRYLPMTYENTSSQKFICKGLSWLYSQSPQPRNNPNVIYQANRWTKSKSCLCKLNAHSNLDCSQHHFPWVKKKQPPPKKQDPKDCCFILYTFTKWEEINSCQDPWDSFMRWWKYSVPRLWDQ